MIKARLPEDYQLPDEKRAVLIEQLNAQYKLFRDEARVYVAAAAASITLLALLLFSELTAAVGKDYPSPKFYVLIPLTLVWYGGVLSLLLINLQIAAKYALLIECQLNELLSIDVFNYERKYIFPTRGTKHDEPSFAAFMALIGILPVACGLWAGYLGLKTGFGFSTLTSVFILLLMLFGFVLELYLVFRVRQRRDKQTLELLEEWKVKLQDLSKTE